MVMLRSVRSVVLSAAMAAGLAVAGAAGAATFTNGSFENSDPAANPGGGFVTLGAGSTAIDGWTVGPNTIDYIGGYWQPEDGNRSIDLSGNQAGGISQTFDTIFGQSYLVSFFLAGNPDGGTGAKLAVTSATGGPLQTDTFIVGAGNTRANMGWQAYSYRFKATGTSTTLSFSSATQTPYGPALDNVSVSAAPEPAQWALMLMGFGGLGAVMRAKRRTAVAA
jgi:choice-of-anchor C domain-containing protein